MSKPLFLLRSQLLINIAAGTKRCSAVDFRAPSTFAIFRRTKTGRSSPSGWKGQRRLIMGLCGQEAQFTPASLEPPSPLCFLPPSVFQHLVSSRAPALPGLRTPLASTASFPYPWRRLLVVLQLVMRPISLTGNFHPVLAVLLSGSFRSLNATYQVAGCRRC